MILTSMTNGNEYSVTAEIRNKHIKMERDKAATVIAKFLENGLTTSNQQEMTEALLKALSDMYKMADIEDIVIKSTQDGTNYRTREVNI